MEAEGVSARPDSPFREGFREKRVLVRDLPLYVSSELLGMAWLLWSLLTGTERLSSWSAVLVAMAYAAGGGVLAALEVAYLKRKCRDRVYYILGWKHYRLLVLLWLSYSALASGVSWATSHIGTTVNDLGPLLLIGLPAGWALGTVLVEAGHRQTLCVRKGLDRDTGRSIRAYVFEPQRT